MLCCSTCKCRFLMHSTRRVYAQQSILKICIKKGSSRGYLKLLVFNFKYNMVQIQAILKDSLDDLFCIFDVSYALPLNYRALFCRKINVKIRNLGPQLTPQTPISNIYFNFPFVFPKHVLIGCVCSKKLENVALQHLQIQVFYVFNETHFRSAKHLQKSVFLYHQWGA